MTLYMSAIYYYAWRLLLDNTEDGSDEECDHEDKVDEVIEQLKLIGNDVGESAATSQGMYVYINANLLLTVNYHEAGTIDLITSHPSIAGDAHIDPGQPLCRKNIGKKRKLRKWSRGHQFIIRGGGHIDAWQPLFQ